MAGPDTFDAAAKEHALRAQAAGWDTSAPVDAEPGDVPVIDVAEWFTTGSADALAAAAAALRTASMEVGFHQLTGHGVGLDAMATILDWTERFHALPEAVKSRVEMDRPGWPLGGVGWLPVGHRKLPTRALGNLNEAFLVKSDRTIGPDDNQWLPDDALPGFRDAVLAWGDTMSNLALRLLPLYATALELEPDFFASAFTHPFYRLRLSHYPPIPDDADPDAHGISPHVDTTFFTLLLQSGPGLTIFSHLRDQWIRVPVVEGAFVVNSGELLRQWTNDVFLSTRHYADNPSADNPGAGAENRYSVPFFFNANGDHRMVCLPTCTGPDNPPKYPPTSYLESQGIVQGE